MNEKSETSPSPRDPEPAAQGWLPNSSQIVQVETSRIQVPRERVTSIWEAEIEPEFAESVRAKGILSPVSLLEIDGELWLIDGLHRLQMAEKLGLPTVPAIIKKGTVEDLLIENLIANRQRGKSNPAEEADVLAYLVNVRAFPLETAVKQMGLSLDWGKKLLRISQLPQEVKDLIKLGKIPVTGAFYLVDLSNPQEQQSVARDAALYGYTAYQIKARVGQLLNPDQEPDEGSYKFAENGTPQKIPIRCRFCGAELPEVGKQYIWICGTCEADAADLLKAYHEGDKQQTKQQIEEAKPRQT